MPVDVLVIYRLKSGAEEAFRPLLKAHWPTLDAHGLVSKQKPQIWRTSSRDGKSVAYVELMQWKDESSSNVAHQTPEVMRIWEPMGPLLENLEINHVTAPNL